MTRSLRSLDARTLVLIAGTIAILAAACTETLKNPSSAAPASPATVSVSPASPSPTAVEPLVGEWARTLRCPDLVAAYGDAGLQDYVRDMVWGSFFWPQIPTIGEFVFDPKDPCRGARPRLHSHFFTATGAFGSRDENGQQVDDGTYDIVRDNRVVINDVTFRYHIDGDTIAFDPMTPDCSPCFAAAWSIAVASPGGKWQRVG